MFAINGHSEKIGTKWHEVRCKRYWERFLSCGRPADPEKSLGTEILSWQRIDPYNN